MWRTVQLEAVRENDDIEPDDDTSLYRLFGFGLHASIRLRKRVIYGKLHKRSRQQRRREYFVQLQILKSLVETDKSVLPACIRLQDRGKMTFPNRSFLPFARECSREIKKHLNTSSFRKVGRHVMQVCFIKNLPSVYYALLYTQIAKRAALENDALLMQFQMFVRYLHKEDVPENICKIVFKEIITRVVNTMSNSFLHSQDILQRIADNKGVDAQMSLRDKLKAYAGEIHGILEPN